MDSQPISGDNQSQNGKMGESVRTDTKLGTIEGKLQMSPFGTLVSIEQNSRQKRLLVHWSVLKENSRCRLWQSKNKYAVQNENQPGEPSKMRYINFEFYSFCRWRHILESRSLNRRLVEIGLRILSQSQSRILEVYLYCYPLLLYSVSHVANKCMQRSCTCVTFRVNVMGEY